MNLASPLAPDTLPGQLALAAAVAFAAWLLLYAGAVAATRNGTVVPAPAGQDLGPDPEPPAVVNLLANGWRSLAQAAPATLLDLAARGLVELRQPGNDPAETTVHLTARAVEQVDTLTPYERRVLARAAEAAGPAGAPIGAIAFRETQQAAAWNRSLRREVIADSRVRGLSRPRIGGALGSILWFSAFVPAVPAALAVIVDGHAVRAAVTVGILCLLPTMGLLALLLTERSTPEGLRRAGHWAGLRDWLAGHEEFAQLPPAAVAVWDRYPAYGTALGVVSRTARLLGFDSGDRRRVWSDHGGTWRPVRISYPRLRPGFGGTPAHLLRLAGTAAAVGAALLLFTLLRQPDWVLTGAAAEDELRRPGLVLGAGWVLVGLLGFALLGRIGRWTPLVLFLSLMPGAMAPVDGWWADTALRGGPAPVELAVVVAAFALAAVQLVYAVLARRAPVAVDGELLRVESRRSKHAPRLVALDGGATDRTTAWALPRDSDVRVPGPGAKVRLSVNPWTRVITAVEPLPAGAPVPGPADPGRSAVPA
ncbi:DUF2207 family protein [Kitasatospora sp. NPDC048365]|uniref:DUF2207 family protein n=1 Tax=Kitasatospora sp. NPDC048365 TaxID=3364050 RepID=UPI0037181F67